MLYANITKITSALCSRKPARLERLDDPLHGVLLGGRIEVRCQLPSCNLMPRPSFRQRNIGIYAEGESLLFPIEAIVVAPIATLIWHY